MNHFACPTTYNIIIIFNICLQLIFCNLQLLHRIDAFVQYKRHLVDMSNQIEFCHRSSPGKEKVIEIFKLKQYPLYFK